MICAYDKLYLEKARAALGRMLDFAVHDLGYDLEEFFNLFIKTGLADRFGTGDFSLIVGMSGVELAYKVLDIEFDEKEQVFLSHTTKKLPEKTREAFHTVRLSFQ